MKLIIDIPKESLVAIETGLYYMNNIHNVIAQGIPYEERPTGDWLWLGFDDGDSRKWSCNICGRGVVNQENFCPNCGADMRGDRE